MMTYEEIERELVSVLRHRGVPDNEVSKLTDAIKKYTLRRVPGPARGCEPTVGVLVGGPTLGRCHVNFLVTWPELHINNTDNARLMNSLSVEFRKTVAALRQDHVRAHLEFVPASSVKPHDFEEYLSERAGQGKYAVVGSWSPVDLVAAAAA